MESNHFETFKGLIVQVFTQFHVWKNLQDSNNNKGYNANPLFWSSTMRSLKEGFVLNLANLFDENKHYPILTVYSTLEESKNKKRANYLIKRIKSKKYEITLKNLKCWRNNIIAHKNIHFSKNIKEISTKFPIKYGQLESLLNLLVNIITRIKNDFNKNDGTNYQTFFDDIEKRCESNTQFVLKNGLHRSKSFTQNKEEN